MRAINVLLAILVSAILALGIFNAGLSLLGFGPQPVINRFDAKLGWSKQPGLTAKRHTKEFDVTFEINDLGLRDDPMTTKAKEPNTFRVLVLGDSFVLGYTVDRDDLFVDQIERWWQAEDRRVDVINAGTEGYSTDQEVAWFLDEGVEYDPDLVLIFPYENDIYWNGQTEYFGKQKPRFEPDGTREARQLEESPSVAPKWALQNFLGSLSSPSGPPQHHFDFAGKSLYAEWAPLLVDEPAFLADCIARTKGALTALRDACGDRDIELLMVPIPSESVVHAEAREAFRTSPRGLAGLDDSLWNPNKPVDRFMSLAKELGIRAIDPRSALKARGADEPLYFDAEWHFNPAGNAAFATVLHDDLDGLGVFPAGHSAREKSDLPAPPHGGGFPFWAKLYIALLLVLGTCYTLSYRDEPPVLAFLRVGGLLALVFATFMGVKWLMGVDPRFSSLLGIVFVVGILAFVAYKLGRRLGTIAELLKSFTLRGHWYLMPLVVVLLTIGSLLVVAASSPLIAPFIYTLF